MGHGEMNNQIFTTIIYYPCSRNFLLYPDQMQSRTCTLLCHGLLTGRFHCHKRKKTGKMNVSKNFWCHSVFQNNGLTPSNIFMPNQMYA